VSTNQINPATGMQMEIDNREIEENKKVKKETVVDILEPDRYYTEVIFKPR
jgi:hypothetical protein